MCRLVGYLGPPRLLEAFLTGPDHSLSDQSRHPRELPPGAVNADGFGVAWYSSEGPEPAAYCSLTIMAHDDNIRSMARNVRSRCVVASLRSATGDAPPGLANTPPYVRGRHAFAHNGSLEDFASSLMRPLREGLSDEAYGAIRGNTDSELLFAALLDRLAAAPSAEGALLAAVRDTLLSVARLSRERGKQAQLNLLCTDGESLVAARFSEATQAPSLYLLDDGEGRLFASEPLFDDERWERLAPGALVSFGPAGASRESLPWRGALAVAQGIPSTLWVWSDSLQRGCARQ